MKYLKGELNPVMRKLGLFMLF